MNKEELYNRIVEVSQQFIQGIPDFIADQYPEEIKALEEEGKVIKKVVLFKTLPNSVFYILPENEEAFDNKFGLAEA